MTFRFSSPLPALAVLTAVGALAWTGCGPGSGERYYCDDGGCYQCDAYGCSDVPAPTTQACTGASSCPSGQVCTTNGCAQQCASDASCPKGTVCKSGTCTAPGTTPGGTKECTTKSDCGDGKICAAGVCQACGGNAGPCPCTASTDCTGGLTCVAGSCTAPSNTCKFSSECAQGKICADGQCLSDCTTLTCGDGFTCSKGVCEPNAPGSNACTGDASCNDPAAPKCVAGSCVASCTTDDTCGSGKFCDQGACVVDTRPAPPNCTSDASCTGSSAPQKCVDGFCKYTCSTSQGDAYCRTIFVEIGYCAKDGVCRTQAEATAACVQKSDCTGGQDCIGNVCK